MGHILNTAVCDPLMFFSDHTIYTGWLSSTSRASYDLSVYIVLWYCVYTCVGGLDTQYHNQICIVKCSIAQSDILHQINKPRG